MKSIFSVDIEDWFNILAVKSEPDISAWDSLPTCVESDFRRMLDIFCEYGVQVTCFFLGYFAKRFPHLVKGAQEGGHEIASHGFAHKLVFQQTAGAFFDDISLSKKILEDIAGVPVRGYRAAAFSVTQKTPWFFEKLIEAGFTYDSSVFPASRGIGGIRTGIFHPYIVRADNGEIAEFPITAVKIMGKPMCLFGGGYLRLFPYPLIRAMARRALGDNRPIVVYVHPREINPEQPRLPMNLKRRFKTYVNLRTTEPKIRSLLRDFEFTTFQQFMNANPDYLVPERKP